MHLFLRILVVALLLIIVYQDYKYRAVWWYIFPLLFLAFLGLLFLEQGLPHLFPATFINMAFIATLLLTLTLYFSVKAGSLVNITHAYLGWGDIAFLLVISIVFSPVNYILFFTSSLFLVVLLVLLKPSLRERIPLAGGQAFFLAILFTGNSLYPCFNFNQDYWIIQFLR